jgi:uncharacterized protein (TIGR03067 family)
MRANRVLVLALGLLGASMQAAGGPAGAADDRARLRGTWVCVSMERNGRPIPPDRYKDGKLVMEGETFTYYQEGQVFTKGTRRLDPSASPKAVDDTHTFGPLKGKSYKGIYKLEGDTFVTCNGSAGQARPTAFTTTPGSNLLLIVYRREGAAAATIPPSGRE